MRFGGGAVFVGEDFRGQGVDFERGRALSQGRCQREREREGGGGKECKRVKTNLASGVTSTQPPTTSFFVGGGRRNFRFFRFFFPPSRGRRSNVDKVNVNVLWFVTGQKVEEEGVGVWGWGVRKRGRKERTRGGRRGRGRKEKKLGKSARILWYGNLKRRPHVFGEVIQKGSCPPGSPASSLRTRNVGFIVTALLGSFLFLSFSQFFLS
jgi:hypothetical protein